MRINRQSYEVFFIDYYDGVMDAALQGELFSFLADNPDLKKEFEDYEVLVPPGGDVAFEHKELLKKGASDNQISPYNFEQHCIACIEGDLNESQQKEFQDFLVDHPEMTELFGLYKKAKLQPEKSLVFFGKNDLKKGATTFSRLVRYAAVAASIALLGGLAFFFHPGNQLITEIPEPPPSTDVHPRVPITPAYENEVLAHANPVIVESLITHTGAEQLLVQEQPDKPSVPRELLGNLPSREPSSLVVERDGNMLASMRMPATKDFDDQPKDPLTNLLGSVDDMTLALNAEGVDGSGRITIWDLAHAGINGIGRLTGANMKVEKKTDEEGRLTALAFQSRNLSFTKRINE